jgi:hypothetical protein
MARLKMPRVERHEPWARLAHGGNEDRQMLWIGLALMCGEIGGGRIVDNAQTAADEHTERWQCAWQIARKVAIGFGDDLLRDNGVNQCDLGHPQHNQARTVL